MILIHGTGTHNKGAELMAVAILQHYRSKPAPPQFAVPPGFGPYAARAQYGLWTLVSERRWGRSRLAVALMSRPFRQKYGLVAESDITAVLDASGFAFGDQHGPQPTQAMAENCRRWKRQGKRIVLLPQAFGPFTSAEIRHACRQLVQHCDLVFAREETSFGHLVETTGQQPHVRQAPDFTNLVEGQPPQGFTPRDAPAYVVPNQRMLDKTDPATREHYLPFLAGALEAIDRSGLSPVVLLHAPEDEALATQLSKTSRCRFDVLSVPCPVALKGILGTGRLVVSSRFHALVGALSQGVPALACGWSHKYQELMRQYDCPECLLSVHDAAELPARIAHLADGPGRADLLARIRHAAERQRAATEAMWHAVDEVLACHPLAGCAPTGACHNSPGYPAP